MSSSIEEILALSEELDWLVTDRDRIAWCDSGDISEHTAERRAAELVELLSNRGPVGLQPTDLIRGRPRLAGGRR